MLTIVDNAPANNRYTVECSWITEAGLPAVVAMGRPGFRCGYVAVPESSILYGVDHTEQIPQITTEMAEQFTLGLKSPILAVTARYCADDDNSIRRSLDIVIDVHGGLTYSGEDDGYPIQLSDPGWWFGYDCNHHGDENPGGQPNWYCREQCESLAKQLAAFV